MRADRTHNNASEGRQTGVRAAQDCIHKRDMRLLACQVSIHRRFTLLHRWTVRFLIRFSINVLEYILLDRYGFRQAHLKVSFFHNCLLHTHYCFVSEEFKQNSHIKKIKNEMYCTIMPLIVKAINVVVLHTLTLYIREKKSTGPYICKTKFHIISKFVFQSPANVWKHSAAVLVSDPSGVIFDLFKYYAQ